MSVAASSACEAQSSSPSISHSMDGLSLKERGSSPVHASENGEAVEQGKKQEKEEQDTTDRPNANGSLPTHDGLASSPSTSNGNVDGPSSSPSSSKSPPPAVQARD